MLMLLKRKNSEVVIINEPRELMVRPIVGAPNTYMSNQKA